MSVKSASQRKVFQIHGLLVKTQNPKTLNPLLRSLTDSNDPKNALLMYNQMLAHNRTHSHCHNHYTFTHALKACTKSLDHLRKGLEIHAHVTKIGHVSDIFIQNTLLHFYVTHSDVVSASKTFDSIPRPNVVSWSLIVSGLSKCGFEEEAIVRFSSMDVEPNSFTLVSLISACSGLKALNLGKAVHGYTFRNGLENNSIILDNAILDFYSKCGSLANARQMFDEMPERDVFSWSTLVGGCAQRGLCEEAAELFRRMIEDGNTEPNDVTLVNLLSACSSVGALNLGQWIYSYINARKTDTVSSVNVHNALINMFVKCGDLGKAVRVFNGLKDKDVIAWSSMINGMAMNGRGSQVSELFSQMVVHGVIPDEGTFVGLLSACSHAGLVDQGLTFFYSMRRVYRIEPQGRHYAIVVDMYGRARMLKAAEDLIGEMPIEADSAIWGALLNACKIHGDSEMIERIGQRSGVINGGGGCRGTSGGAFALLSNAYAGCGRWSDSDEIRSAITRLGLKKVAGCSWIEAEPEM